MKNVLDVGIKTYRLALAKNTMKFVIDALKILKKMEKKDNLFNLKSFVFIIFCVLLDIWTKQLAVSNLRIGETQDFILPFIDLLLIFNSGIAFGILDNNDYMTSIILLLIGISIVIYLLYLSLHEEDRFKKLALITIVAGAIGNIIDRGMDGYVTDFLHLKINDFSFFIFNLADAFISIGAIIIIFFELKSSSSYDKAN